MPPSSPGGPGAPPFIKVDPAPSTHTGRVFVAGGGGLSVGRPYRPHLPLPSALQESLFPRVGADVPAQRLASPRPLLRPPHPSFLPLSSLSFHHLFLSFASHSSFFPQFSSSPPNHRFIKILFKTVYYFPSFQLPPASFPQHTFPGHVFMPISALSSHLFVRKAVDASARCLLGPDLRLPGPWSSSYQARL